MVIVTSDMYRLVVRVGVGPLPTRGKALEGEERAISRETEREREIYHATGGVERIIGCVRSHWCAATAIRRRRWPVRRWRFRRARGRSLGGTVHVLRGA